ncbi:MAG: hypothetical protein IKD15_00410 [Clostridia bacterium]|nr:hypothetical protein [Clostridia bacterium]
MRAVKIQGFLADFAAVFICRAQSKAELVAVDRIIFNTVEQFADLNIFSRTYHRTRTIDNRRLDRAVYREGKRRARVGHVGNRICADCFVVFHQVEVFIDCNVCYFVYVIQNRLRLFTLFIRLGCHFVDASCVIFFVIIGIYVAFARGELNLQIPACRHRTRQLRIADIDKRSRVSPNVPFLRFPKICLYIRIVTRREICMRKFGYACKIRGRHNECTCR